MRAVQWSLVRVHLTVYHSDLGEVPISCSQDHHLVCELLVLNLNFTFLNIKDPVV